MKKILLALLFFTLLLIFKTNTIFAQDSSPRPLYPLNTNPDVKQDFHTYTQNVFIEVLSTATCFIGGTDIINPQQKCLGIDPVTKKIGYVENSGGLASVVGGMISATYNIPISTSHYGHYLASHFGITKNSYAANAEVEGKNNTSTGFGMGIGFVGLTPVMDIWKTFRNLTYLLFVFIFILLGLGIMFRLNIDARTVMTIQNQIPKIIIGLILITLSYAIAGFLIDMMYVAIYLVIHVFDSQGLTTMTNIATNPVRAIGSLGGINDIAAPAAKGVGDIMASIFSGGIGSLIGAVVTGIIGGFIGNTVGSFLGPVGGVAAPIIGAAGGGLIGAMFGSKIIGWIATAIAYLIISISIFSALFRVWFMLIKAYIFIFLDVIFAPFWIVGGLLPGAPGGFGPWIRSLIANLAAFPTVIVLFMIGKTIQDQAFKAGSSFIPPLIGNPGSNAGDSIASLLGLGIILVMPEAVTMTKSTLKAPDLKYTAAIGKAIGVGTAATGWGQKQVKNALWYTNPKTGEAGRLKAWAGNKVQQKLGNSRLTGRATKFFQRIMPTSPSKAHEQREAAIERARESFTNNRPDVARPAVGAATQTEPTNDEIRARAIELAKERNMLSTNNFDRDLTSEQKEAAQREARLRIMRERGYDVRS